jgi:putative ABC transport system permease protein
VIILNDFNMFNINIKIAIRNILRNKGFFIINVAGLTLGLSCSLLIFLWVYNELSFDRFHTNFNRIFQLQQVVYLDKEKYTTERVGGAQGPTIASKFPEVKLFARTGLFQNELLLSYIPRNNTQQRINLIEKNGLAVDSSFLKIFTFPLLSGNSDKALKDVNSIILTEKTAKKYFLNEDPIGKTILVNEKIELFVTGVMKDIPVNSNIQFDFLVPFNLLKEFQDFNDSYDGTSYITYFLLYDNASEENLNGKIAPYLKSIWKSQLECKPFLVSLGKVHLYDEKRLYIGVYSFIAIAIQILITACINFINLTTARSFDRAKEVGIKKTEGASRGQLIQQFLGETILTTLISLFIAMIIVELVRPLFNTDANTHISLDLRDPVILAATLLLVIITGFLAGIYPAFILSSYNPMYVIRNIRKSGKSGSLLRKILVITQFSISIFCIIGTTILVLQLKYMRTADQGFNKDNLIIVPVRGQLKEKINMAKSDLLSSPSILNVTTSSELPDNVMYGEIRWGKPDNENNQSISRIMYTDYDFAETFQIKMKEGRFYSKDFSGDSINAIVINPAIVEHMGYENPLGKSFYFYDKEYTIIGVIDDFHFFPFNLGGKALFIMLSEQNKFMFVKFREGEAKQAISHILNVTRQINPNYPPEYIMFDEYDRILYRIAKNSNKFLIIITPLALIISCLGLIGLAIFTAEIRTKEIGIRKAFGASINNIIYCLFRDFGILISISILISMPLVYLVMKAVLNFFSIRIQISPWIFILTTFLLFGLTFIITGWQVYKAANKNPVTCLRYE